MHLKKYLQTAAMALFFTAGIAQAHSMANVTCPDVSQFKNAASGVVFATKMDGNRYIVTDAGLSIFQDGRMWIAGVGVDGASNAQEAIMKAQKMMNDATQIETIAKVYPRGDNFRAYECAYNADRSMAAATAEFGPDSQLKSMMTTILR